MAASSYQTKAPNTEVVSILIEAGANIETPNKGGRTPLHEAAICNSAGVIRILGQKGANVDARDEDGNTALHLARGKQDADSVIALLELGADPTARNKRGMTPLHKAAFDGDEPKAKVLLDHGADPHAVDGDGVLPILSATCAGQTSLMKLLFQRGVDVNQRTKTGRTLLYPAMSSGSEEAVRLILSQEGFDLNAGNNKGRTALMDAVKSGWKESMVQLLVEQPGVDLNIADNEGNTALSLAHEPIVARLLLSGTELPSREHMKHLASIQLHHAAQTGDAEEIRRLLKEGIVDPNTRDREGVAPLMKASFMDHCEAVEALLECDSVVVDLEEKNPGKHGPKVTMLYYASFNDWEPMARLLLSKGVKLNEEDGRRILRWAANCDYEELARLALEKGADPNGRDDDTYRAPLHMAASRGTVYRTLLESGADPNLAWQSKGGLQTPVSLAASNGHVDCVKLLLGKSAKDRRSEDWLKVAKLRKATKEGDETTGIEILERESIDTTWKDEDGCTPLHKAAENGCAPIIRLILQHDNSTLNWKNYSNETALLVACQRPSREKRFEVVRELLKHPAVDLNIQRREGWETPLMAAAKNGDEECVRHLLDHGASVGIRDGRGELASNYALRSGNRRVMETLRIAEQSQGCSE
jgi:ankyrin repeat protein